MLSCTAAVAIAPWWSAGWATTGRDALKSRADAVLHDHVSSGRVPGVVAALTDPTDTIYAGAQGTIGLGETAPISLDTVMAVFSMTKPLTSTAALQLVERGKLKLDEPAAKYLPQLSAVQVLEGYDASGAPRLRSPRRPVTLRHLLTHTSGFTYDIWDANLNRYYTEQNIPRLATRRKAALNVPIAFDPGDRWQYGIGIDWVGLLVEAASGQALGDYLERHLTGPLGMSSTGFQPSPEMRARLSKMHTRDNDGKLSVMAFAQQQNSEFEPGGSGLYSTAADYLKFLRMILNRGRAGGQQIVKPETVDLMSRNAIGPLRVGQLHTAIPFLSRNAEFFPDTPKTWSLAFMINESKAPTGRSAGSMAWAGLANTYFWIDPAKRIAGLAMMQLFPFVDPQALGVFLEFEKSAYMSI
ncbi:beta-lactamase family protein [Cupriavidus necator]|uniref:Class A beta-lactamase-related serine hydrolase n=2 Tax=Cupriavidus necator TaxID=106590 RepID=A0A367PH03_CUPNE|nr:beta-lactamase family protein [Cupriavidus necator]RCJ06813.1 class A beta-lactamase-related serine hydrolase [Cupriavidus necator]